MYPVVQSKHIYILQTSFHGVSSHWIEIALLSDHALISFDPAVYNDITYIDNTVHAFQSITVSI